MLLINELGCKSFTSSVFQMTGEVTVYDPLSEGGGSAEAGYSVFILYFLKKISHWSLYPKIKKKMHL